MCAAIVIDRIYNNKKVKILRTLLLLLIGKLSPRHCSQANKTAESLKVCGQMKIQAMLFVTIV